MTPVAFISRFRRSVARVLSAAAIAVGMTVAGMATLPSPALARGAPDSFADLAQTLSPTVVNISTTQTLRRPGAGQTLPDVPPGSPLEDFFKDFLENGQPAPRRVTSLGSGFVLDPTGIIVTNNHVIEGADAVTVIFNDGTSLPAQVIGRDDKTDVALLRVHPKAPLAAARFGDSDKARVGDWVMAIGNPFGLGGTVTAGIVSARNRDINAGPYDDFIQTDASINRGNSGGPLFNMDGEVIGVNSAIYSPTGGSVGIGFAIPANEAKAVIAQLRQFGSARRGWLGVRIQGVSDEIAESLGLPSARGALVAGVTEGGPAAKAGIQNGDLILLYDGKPVPDSRTLPRMVAETPIGKTVAIQVLRKGQRLNLTASVARLADDTPPARATNALPNPRGGAPAKQLVSRLGVSLSPLTAELRTRYRIGAGVQGVVITEVDPDGPAAEKNIIPGDVIVEVAQQKVTTPAQADALLNAQVRAHKGVVLLQINRGGQVAFVGVKLQG
jgi:serine protease Do